MINKILIANRGEIAIRIARAAAGLKIKTVTVYSSDDNGSLHISTADQAFLLEGIGAAAYLDMEQLISIARASGCDAIHPGYGFLSENPDFARRCHEEGLIFIGPRSELLELFGDKLSARRFARECGVPLLPGSDGPVTLKEAKEFFMSLGPDAAVMIKAVSGGGGRGMRPVYNIADLDEAYARCRSEARKAFGSDEVYIEQLIHKPRHIEVQIIGDGHKAFHLGERDCTLQRRNQKVIEISPCPTLSPLLREKITGAALCLAQAAYYSSLGTFEFLVDGEGGDNAIFAFMEANPRLQVEHTVTEEVTGIDLVKAQIEIAGGKSLADIGLTEDSPYPACYAMQMRINLETIDSTGSARPSAGILKAYDMPSGTGIRVDGYGYTGYQTNPAFDSLLAKLIVTSASPDYKDTVRKAVKVLSEVRIEGVATNIPFLSNLLQRPEMGSNDFYTCFIEEHAEELAVSSAGEKPGTNNIAADGTLAVTAPGIGRIIEIAVAEGDEVDIGQTLVVIESMKMECEIRAKQCGFVQTVCAQLNDVICEGDPLLYIEGSEIAGAAMTADDDLGCGGVRPELAELIKRHSYGLDVNRPEVVAKRQQKNQRTARTNVEDLIDEGSFIEYGALAIAAQRQRRSVEDLIVKTPADGLIAGVGTVNASLVGDDKARCMVMAYDYSVLAGTQGFFNHKKMDRMLKLANDQHLPLVLFAEGGGGRPGDTDATGVMIAGLDLATFASFASLSGKVPMVGIVSGPCFAGNAALLGCCDVIIATENSNIGMGGPVMIEGGGLGTFRPEEVGPIDVQTANGVVDIAVKDDVEAVAAARKYLSYFQGPIKEWEAGDQKLLRDMIPENRRRVYDVRKVIKGIADVDSYLELRPKFGPGIITGFIRVEGKPFGVIANNCRHMGGAIEAEGADKAARLMQLCNAHGIPILSICDTPGFMVGPDIEQRAQVRHVCRMFVVGSHITVPYFTLVVRRGYGLGAMAMAKGGFHESFFTAAWPTGEFGAMGLEGAVKAGFRRELDAVADPDERKKLFDTLLGQLVEMGKAVNMAAYLEIDAVIDPADTRKWLMQGLKSVPRERQQSPPFVDTW